MLLKYVLVTKVPTKYQKYLETITKVITKERKFLKYIKLETQKERREEME